LTRSGGRRRSGGRSPRGGGRGARSRGRAPRWSGPLPLGLRLAAWAVLAVSFAAGFAAAGALVELDRQVRARFEGTQFRVPSRVYSAPDILYPGLDWKQFGLRDVLSQAPQRLLYLHGHEHQPWCWRPVVLPGAVVVHTPPTAAFTPGDTAACVPFGLRFLNQSTFSDGAIVAYEWDFGDGSDPAFGHEVTHIYEEGSSAEFPYRVKMTIHFADSQGPESIFRTLALPVSDTPTPGSCPPDSVVVQIFARDTVFQTSSTGCATADIADHLVSIDGELARGNAELTFDYEWEALPENTQARAILSISYIDENDTPIERDLINLTEESGGKYSLRELIEVPEVTSAEFAVSFIVFDNPTSKLISLVIKPITLTFESE